MKDYCAGESTLNMCDDRIERATVCLNIRKANEILRDTKAVLSELTQFVSGESADDEKQRDASCLWEETRMLAELATENYKRLIDIKEKII